METKKTVFKVSSDIQDIMPNYLNNRRKDLFLLTEALEKSDFLTLATIGHKIKGTAGGYGLDPLSAIGAAIEVAGKTQDLNGGKQKLDEMKNFLDHLEIQFE
jgi:HPt (histidine-containing phosphotransfer) domain-containing protein